MRIQGLVGRTLRAAPAGMAPALGVAARAGFVRPAGGGLIVLPLGALVIDHIERQLLSGLGCEPIEPVMGSGDLREAVIGLLRTEVQSYRQLPLRIATRGRGRLSLADATASEAAEMLTVAGAHTTDGERAAFLGQIDDRIGGLGRATRIVLVHALVAGDVRASLVVRDEGANAMLACTQCGTWMLREGAPFSRGEATPGEGRSMELVYTPGATTIQALAEMLDIGREQTLKALFLTTRSGELVLVVVGGIGAAACNRGGDSDCRRCSWVCQPDWAAGAEARGGRWRPCRARSVGLLVCVLRRRSESRRLPLRRG